MSAQRITIVTTILLALACSAAPARAQGAYVNASLIGDITRVSHSGGFFEESAGGEAIGFALRVGTPVGANWGVEAEFARSGKIANGLNPRALPAVTDPFSTLSGGGYVSSLPGGNSLSVIFPTPVGYDFRTTVQHTTLATTAWVRQDATSRVSLVYLGGLNFVRATHAFDVRVLPAVLRPTLILPTSESFIYSVRPIVGIEARVRLTDHVELVPGVRLSGIDGGWLIRPAVGLGWGF